MSEEKKENAAILKKSAAMYASNGSSLYIICGDSRDKEKLIETIKKYNVTSCVHVAGLVDDRRSVAHPEEYIDVNVRGTATLYDALGQCGVKTVVQASTRSVFGQRDNNHTYLTESADRRPVNPFGASKVGADAMAHAYSHLYNNMNVTLVRSSYVWSPWAP